MRTVKRSIGKGRRLKSTPSVFAMKGDSSRRVCLLRIYVLARMLKDLRPIHTSTPPDLRRVLRRASTSKSSAVATISPNRMAKTPWMNKIADMGISRST